MTAKPSIFYGDPLKVLLEGEKHSCKGCAFEGSVSWELETVHFCEKGLRHGTRCGKYVEREDSGGRSSVR